MLLNRDDDARKARRGKHERGGRSGRALRQEGKLGEPQPPKVFAGRGLANRQGALSLAVGRIAALHPNPPKRMGGKRLKGRTRF